MSLPTATALASPAPADTRSPDHLDGPAGFTRALLRDFGGYLVSLGLLTLGNLLLLPLITAYLTPAELGLYSLVETVLTQGITLSLLGMKFAYLYYYAQCDVTRRPYILGNALMLVLITSPMTGGLLALLFSDAALMARFDADALPMAWSLIPLLISGAVQIILLTELRASRHVRLAGIITVAQLLLWLLLSIWLVALQGAGLPGLLGAQAIAQALSCLIALFLVGPRLVVHMDWRESLRLLRYGVPLMIGLLLRYSLDTIGRFSLAALVSIEAAGLYLVISRVIALFEGLLSLPFLTAWGGLVHHALRRPDAARIIGQISSLAIAASTLLAILILSAQPLLFSVLAHDAMPATAGVFALLLLSSMVQMVRSPLTAGILRSGRTGWSVSNNMLALFIYLAAIFPATRLAGLTGAAFAMLLANLLTGAVLLHSAWPDCPQRLAPTALPLLMLLGVIAGIAVLTGPLPAWICIVSLGIAGFLAWQMRRHIDVTNRL